MNSELHIAVPDIEQAPDILHLRKAIFCEELKTAGVDPNSIERHTADWESEASVESYKRIMEKWLSDERVHYRTVMLGQATIGVFVGSYGVPGGVCAHNDIRVIQLDSSVRGMGVGRTLMAEFDTAANLNLPTSLNVLKGNTPAIGFYQHLEFEAVREGSFTIDSEIVPILNMQKQPAA